MDIVIYQAEHLLLQVLRGNQVLQVYKVKGGILLQIKNRFTINGDIFIKNTIII